MIIGLDSASEPTAAQALAAKAAGISLWSGYLATQSNVGLYHPWPQSAFANARLCGSIPIAFCSGWDNPSACRALADAWKVRLCLDVEGFIRGDGAWVQSWLNASGAGLYGNAPVHIGRIAPFHILAAYGSDPGATWSSRIPVPASPTGWQWWGTHAEFGVGVDRGWYDDWFSGLHGGGTGALGDDMDAHFLAQLVLMAGIGRVAAGGGEQFLVDIINQQNALIAAGTPGDFTGAVLGTVVNSPEGVAFEAKLQWMRDNLDYDPVTKKVTFKGGAGPDIDPVVDLGPLTTRVDGLEKAPVKTHSHNVGTTSTN